MNLNIEHILFCMRVNDNNVYAGTTLGSKPVYAAGGAVLGGVGMGPGLAGLQQHNKFNTISNIHKRGGGELITLYIMTIPSHPTSKAL